MTSLFWTFWIFNNRDKILIFVFNILWGDTFHIYFTFMDMGASGTTPVEIMELGKPTHTTAFVVVLISFEL